MNLREELDRIRSQHGRLTPAVVVDEARSPDHPLHSRFEWDDAVAGEKYRLVQAQQLIRTVKVTMPATVDRGPVSLRAYYSVPSELGGNEYLPGEEVAADPIISALVLRNMRREFEQLQTQYGHLSEFLDMLSAALVP